MTSWNSKILTAATTGDIKLVTDCLAHGAQVDCKDIHQWTPLHIAARNGFTEIARLLINNGATVDILKEGQWTALHMASKYGFTEIASLLINSGATVDIQTKNQWTALHMAARNGFTEIGRLLINSGATVDIQNKNQWTALHMAARYGFTEIARLLINNGATVDIQNKDQWTAVHMAARYGFGEIASLLINGGATVDIQNKNQWTALHMAARNCFTESASLLINGGAMVDIQNKNQWTALHMAARNGFTEIASLLIDSGATVDIKGEDQWTALHMAARYGFTEIASLILNSGATVDIQNKNQWIALHMAAMYGFTEIASLLINSGATVDIQNKDQWTALHMASKYGFTEIASLLINGGATVDIQNKNQWTALHMAARYGFTEIASLFINSGATVDIQNDDQWTALHLSAWYGFTEIASLLINCGATVDIQIKNQWTALHLSARNGFTEIVSLLINGGATVDIQNDDHRTALHMAAWYGFTEIASLLINSGSMVDIQDKNQWTALHMSTWYGFTEIASLLINSGATVDIQNKNQWTALHMAARNGFTEIASLLINSGATVDIQGEDQWTALHMAAWYGFTEIASLLINSGATVDIQEDDQLTALHMAARYGFTEIASLLINSGATVDIQNKDQLTALHISAWYGFTEIARLLINSGAMVDIQEKNQLTSLHLAARFGVTEIASLLTKSGATVDIQNNNQWTALHIAARNGFTEIASLLINSGATFDIQTHDQWTALHIAARYGFTEIASLLINGGATVDIQTHDQLTPLHMAARYGFTEIASLLINSGATVDIQNKDKYTPYDLTEEDKMKEILKAAQDIINAGLPRELIQLGKKTASIFKDLLKEQSYELFELRSMLQGEQGTGKSTIARFLVGKAPTISRRSTDGIDLYTGVSFFDDETEEWIGGKQVFEMEDITISRFLKSLKHQRTPVNQPGQTNTEVSIPKAISSTLSNEISKEMSAKQEPDTVFLEETNKDMLTKQGLTHQSHRENYEDISDTEEIEQMLPKNIYDEILEKQELLSQEFPLKTLEVDASLVPEDTGLEMYDSEKVNFMLPEDKKVEFFYKQEDSHQVKEEDILQLKEEDVLTNNVSVHHSIDEELTSNIVIPQLKEEDMVKKHDLIHQSMDEEFSSNMDISHPEQKTMLAMHGLIHRSMDEELASNIDITKPKEEAVIQKQDLIHHSMAEEFSSNIDITQPEQEAMLKKQGQIHYSKDEELASNIDLPQPKKQAMIKKQDLIHHSTDENLSSINDEVDVKIIQTKSDVVDVEIVRNTGIIEKLKEFFRVKKKVNEVKISVTMTTLYNKAKDASKKEYHKRNLVPVTVWDFGGQDVFYSTHQTFLTYRAVYMLVLDGSRTLNEPCRHEQFLPGKTGVKTQKDYVRFWINTIITYCKGDIPGFPKIIVILTHKDKLNVTAINSRRTEIFSEIERMFDGTPIKEHLAIQDRIFVNARNSKDPEMELIKKCLIHQARIQPTWGQKLPQCFLPLELEIQHLVKNGVTLIHIEQMKKINDQQPIRPLTDIELKVFLKFQHSVGKIIYFDEPHLDKHIIISPTYLIDAFKSIITDRQFCKGDKRKKEAWHSMNQKGIISKQAIEKIWKQKKYARFFTSMPYLLGVMTRLDILVEPLRYDSTLIRKSPEFFYVASMTRKQDTTGYLQSPTFSQRNIALCFDTFSSIIPPALSFRFISYCLSIWGVKTYGDENEDMLFHRSAVFTIDPSLDVHIQCEEKELIVRLVHARNRTLIMKDLASSIRECLSAALHKISQLYIKTSSERTENIRAFDVKLCCSSSLEPCFVAVQDIDDVWICSRHNIEHSKDLVLSWFTEKGKEMCESFCPVTDEQFLLQTPTDLHLLRLALEYNTDEVRQLVIQLNFPTSRWNKLYSSTLTDETIAFTALKKCLKMTSFTFKDLKLAIENLGVQNPHTICKVLRDRHISFDTDPEKWDLTPTDEDIDKLAPVIGNSSLAFLVELGLTFQGWEQIEYSQPERDLVKLNRTIMEAWRTNCRVHNIKPTLRTIGQAFGNIGIHIKNIENLLFV